jgi:hypothetical protein
MRRENWSRVYNILKLKNLTQKQKQIKDSTQRRRETETQRKGQGRRFVALAKLLRDSGKSMAEVFWVAIAPSDRGKRVAGSISWHNFGEKALRLSSNFSVGVTVTKFLCQA